MHPPKKNPEDSNSLANYACMSWLLCKSWICKLLQGVKNKYSTGIGVGKMKTRQLASYLKPLLFLCCRKLGLLNLQLTETPLEDQGQGACDLRQPNNPTGLGNQHYYNKHTEANKTATMLKHSYTAPRESGQEEICSSSAHLKGSTVSEGLIRFTWHHWLPVLCARACVSTLQRRLLTVEIGPGQGKWPSVE